LKIFNVGVQQDADQGGMWGQLAKQSELLRIERASEHVHPSRVAARPAQAGNEPDLDRIGTTDEHDRNRCGRRHSGPSHAGASDRGKHRHPTTHQFGRHRRQQIISPVRPAVFDLYVLAIDVVGLVQSVPERGHLKCVRIKRRDAEKSDYRHRLLLRARRERPCDRAAEQRDELAPFYLTELHLTLDEPGLRRKYIQLMRFSQEVAERF
jgi:hypothetical protein